MGIMSPYFSVTSDLSGLKPDKSSATYSGHIICYRQNSRHSLETRGQKSYKDAWTCFTHTDSWSLAMKSSTEYL